ncbi:unnamed protein product [Brassica rapa subsp. trilocularis]
MDITSKRKAVAETLMKGTGTAAFYSASDEAVHSPRVSCAVSVGDKRKRNELGFEAKGLPKDAYELDQAALPKTIEEKDVPSHLIPRPKPEALCFPKLKIHVSRLKATSFPENVIKWKDKRMPVGCGTFSVPKSCSIFYPQHLTHQIFPETSIDGNEFVEVLDDALNYKVLALERALVTSEEKNHFFRAAKSRPSYCHEEDGTGVIFTIPQSKMLRFSHPLPVSRVTKEVDGEMEVLFEVDKKALPLGP